jgi:hypothetical protein
MHDAEHRTEIERFTAEYVAYAVKHGFSDQREYQETLISMNKESVVSSAEAMQTNAKSMIETDKKIEDAKGEFINNVASFANNMKQAGFEPSISVAVQPEPINQAIQEQQATLQSEEKIVSHVVPVQCLVQSPTETPISI